MSWDIPHCFPYGKAEWGQTSRVPGDWRCPGMWVRMWDGYLLPHTRQSPAPGSREDSPAWEQALPGEQGHPKESALGGCFLGRALRSFQLLQRGFGCKGCISLFSTTLPAQTPGTEWELASLKANWWDWCELDWLLALGCAGVASPLSCGQCSGCWPPLSCSFPWKCAKIPGFDPCPPSNLAAMGRWDPAGLGKTGRQLDRQTDRQSVRLLKPHFLRKPG